MFLNILMAYVQFLNLTSLNEAELPMYIMAFAPYCGYCKRALPFWQNFSLNYENDTSIIVGLLNCVEDKDACAFLQVRGYPTFVFRVNKVSVVVSPKRDVEGFQAVLDNYKNSEKFTFSELGTEFPYFLIEYPEDSFQEIFKLAYISLPSASELNIGYKNSNKRTLSVFFNQTDFITLPEPFSPSLFAPVVREYSMDTFDFWNQRLSSMLRRKQVIYFPKGNEPAYLSEYVPNYRGYFIFINSTSESLETSKSTFKIKDNELPAIVAVKDGKFFSISKNVQGSVQIGKFLDDAKLDKLRVQKLEEPQNPNSPRKKLGKIDILLQSRPLWFALGAISGSIITILIFVCFCRTSGNKKPQDKTD